MLEGTGEYPLPSVSDDGENGWSVGEGYKVSDSPRLYRALVRFSYVLTATDQIEVTYSHSAAWTVVGTFVVVEVSGLVLAGLMLGSSPSIGATEQISTGVLTPEATASYLFALGFSEASKAPRVSVSPALDVDETETFTNWSAWAFGAEFAAGDIAQITAEYTNSGVVYYTYLLLKAKAPTIDTQPANQSKNVAQDATFSVSATASSGSLTYQWQDEAGNISGATSSSLTLANVPKKLSGTKYRVKVTDSNDTIISDWATLTVAYVDPVSGLYVVCYDASMSAPTAEQIANGLQADDDWAAGAATEALRSTTGTQTFQDPITDLTPGVEYKLSFTAVLE
jgi:hypothetical protein